MTIDTEALAEAWKSVPPPDPAAMLAATTPTLNLDALVVNLFGPTTEAYLEILEAKKPELRVVKHDGAEFRWTAYDTRNDLIVAASTQGYNDPRDRDHNIEMVLGGGYRLDLQ